MGLKKLVGEVREKLGRKAKTSFILVDAQSVKNTGSAEKKGYDAGKKVSGIKRHIAVDTQGLPYAVAVTTTDVTDRNGALAAMDRCKPNLESVQSVLADGGYTGQSFADGVMERLQATVQVVKHNELHTLVVLPKRWIVERCFGGWKSAEDCGRTENANSIPVCSSFTVNSSRRQASPLPRTAWGRAWCCRPFHVCACRSAVWR